MLVVIDSHEPIEYLHESHWEIHYTLLNYTVYGI